MKVIFVVSDANAKGGTEILAYHLLDKFTSLGIECMLLSRWEYQGTDSRVISFGTIDYNRWLKLFRSPINKLFGNYFSDRYFQSLVKRMAVENNADWVINHTYDLVSAMPFCNQFKSAQIFHWSIVGYENNLKSGVRMKNIIGRISSGIALSVLFKRWHNVIHKLNRAIVLTDAAASEIKTVCPLISSKRIFTIPDPIIFSSLSEHISQLNNKTLVYVGRLAYEKGVIRLLSIWKRINARLPEYNLLIFGDGHAKQDMLDYIRNNNIENIHFKGFSSDLEQIYTNADLCLMTSDTEGFGMVLIEAMYYGVPCVSFDCPVSPKEIIADAGITIPCFDEDEYANQVVALLKDPDRMKQLQQNAINRARDFYMDKVMDKWMELLNSDSNEADNI